VSGRFRSDVKRSSFPGSIGNFRTLGGRESQCCQSSNGCVNPVGLDHKKIVFEVRVKKITPFFHFSAPTSFSMQRVQYVILKFDSIGKKCLNHQSVSSQKGLSNWLWYKSDFWRSPSATSAWWCYLKIRFASMKITATITTPILCHISL